MATISSRCVQQLLSAGRCVVFLLAHLFCWPGISFPSPMIVFALSSYLVVPSMAGGDVRQLALGSAVSTDKGQSVLFPLDLFNLEQRNFRDASSVGLQHLNMEGKELLGVDTRSVRQGAACHNFFLKNQLIIIICMWNWWRERNHVRGRTQVRANSCIQL